MYQSRHHKLYFYHHYLEKNLEKFCQNSKYHKIIFESLTYSPFLKEISQSNIVWTVIWSKEHSSKANIWCLTFQEIILELFRGFFLENDVRNRDTDLFVIECLFCKYKHTKYVPIETYDLSQIILFFLLISISCSNLTSLLSPSPSKSEEISNQ